MEERRLTRRSPAALFIRITVDDEKRIKCESFTQDVSLTGVRLFATQPLQQNDKLLLNIDIPNDPDIAHAEGNVRWVGKSSLRKQDGKEVFPAGIEFVYMDRQDKVYLEEYLTRYAQA